MFILVDCNVDCTAYEMTWAVNDDLSPAPVNSPLSSVGGHGCGDGGTGLEPPHGDRSSASPDRPPSVDRVTPVECPPSAAVASAQLAAAAAAACLRGSAASLSTADDSPLLAGVQCRLETKELWDKFYELGTEMIITKSGRSVYAFYCV